MTPTTSEPEKLRYQVFYNGEWNDEHEDTYNMMINNNHHGRVLNSKGVTVESTTPMTEPKTAEQSNERLLIRRIWRQAYMETEDKHISLIREYADQQTAQLQEQLKREREVSERLKSASNYFQAMRNELDEKLKQKDKLISELGADFKWCVDVLRVAKESEALWLNDQDWKRFESLIKKASNPEKE